ncbi:unnamed protein product, partial [Owenia fusiformis]
QGNQGQGNAYGNQGNQGEGNAYGNQGNQGQGNAYGNQGNQGQGNAYGQQDQQYQQQQPPPYQQQQQPPPQQQSNNVVVVQQQPVQPQPQTTVVIQQQPAQQQQEPIREQPAHAVVHKNQYGLIDFQQGLFGCFNNCSLCVLTLFCPCYVSGKVAESVGEHCLIYGIASVVPLFSWYFMADARGKVRNLKGIKGSFTQDYIYVIFCPCCSLVQSSREMRGDEVCQAQSMARE